jgi:O-methyltransferase domain
MAMTEQIAPAPPNMAAGQTVFQIALGYIASSALHAVTRLGIADRVANGPVTVDALARDVGVQADPLYRVMRTLASLGVFEERSPRTFASNAAADMLQSRPGSLRDIAMFMTDPLHFRVYAELSHSLETGKPAVEKVVGMPVFEYFAKDVEESSLFNDAMTSMSAAVVPAVLKAYDFSGIGVLADIAGGHGHVLGSILQQYPAMRGMLFDLGHVIAGATAKLTEMGVANRCTLTSGDFFASVPSGADAYIMKHIIHDWDDEQALRILRNIRTALGERKDGRLLLIETVVAQGNQPDFGKLVDLEMMLFPGGRERTADEFAALLARAGFEMTRIVPNESPLAVIEARPR